MVKVKASQKIFTDTETANLTGICLEHLLGLASRRHVGFIARAAEVAGKQPDQWLFKFRLDLANACFTTAAAGRLAASREYVPHAPLLDDVSRFEPKQGHARDGDPGTRSRSAIISLIFTRMSTVDVAPGHQAPRRGRASE